MCDQNKVTTLTWEQILDRLENPQDYTWVEFDWRS